METQEQLKKQNEEMRKALEEVKKLIDWWIEDGYIEDNSASKQMKLINKALKSNK